MAYFRERGDTWSFTIDIGKDAITGKRRQRTVSGFKSERDARKAALKMEQDVERGKRFESITLKDFIEQFFEKHVIHNVSEGTYENQIYWARNFIIPHLGKYKIDKITDIHVENFYEKLAEDGVSKGLVRNIGMVMSKTFRFAHKKKYVVDNIMQHVKTPKYKPERMKVWSKEEMSHFLQITKGSKNHMMYVLALSTGMRAGEIIGLHWEEINFETGKVTIRQSLKYTSKSGLFLKDPKTENSRRTINLPQYAIDALIDYRDNIQLEGLSMVIDNVGNYFYPNEVSRTFKNDVKKFHMRTIRFHDLRHTHATLLFEMGFNAKVVAERLGDTVETVLRTYAHVLPSMQEDVANRLDGIL